MKKMIIACCAVGILLPCLAVHVDIPEGTTEIEARAYENRFDITSITIPNSVTSIGELAFMDCTSLTSVTIPDSVTSIGWGAFSGCISLTSVEMPDSVTSIGACAFMGCRGLADAEGFVVVKGVLCDYLGGKAVVTIPNSVTSIGGNVFDSCIALASVTIPASVTRIDEYAFYNCSGLTSLTIPGSVTSISDGAFWGCSGLTSVTMLDGVTSIGESAFYGCSGLTTVTIPKSVTSIGNEAFRGCSSLASVTIPNSVTNIGSRVFGDCTSLTSVKIPNGVTRIKWRVFSGCTSLRSVTIPNSVTSIDFYAFADCPSLYDTTTIKGLNLVDGWVVGYNSDCPSVLTLKNVRGVGASALRGFTGLTSVTIPKSVTSIDEDAFRDCSSLTSLTIPGSVTSISDDAFSGCSSLKSVTILDGVTSIGGCAFFDCSGLTSVTIPASVTSIGTGAFKGCRGLADSKGFVIVNGVLCDYVGGKDMTIPASVTSVGGGAFYGCRELADSEGFVVVNGILYDYVGGKAVVTIPNSVTAISDYAFVELGSLTSVTIPDSVTSIGIETFRGCANLTSVTIPNSVTSIGYKAFRECGLSEVSVSERTKIAKSAFDSGVVITRRPAEVIPSVDGDDDNPSAPKLDASYGPFVPGEAVELDLPSLVGYAAKGLPSGLKFNTKTGAVTGAAKKPTGDDGAKVTFTKKGEATLTTHFIVGPVPMVSVTLAGDTEKCSVAGAGKAYLAGKKVTLAAKAPKGTAFLGWTKGGVPWPDAESAKKAKLSFEMPSEDVALVATFEKEKMTVDCPTLKAGSFTVGVAGDAAEGLPLVIETQSGVKSVKAAKLPSGMKLVKEKVGETGEWSWSIVGTPTKAGTYTVVLTVTAVSGATETVTIPVTVEPLPAWAVGTFGGMVGFFAVPDGESKEDFFPCGSITLKVAATGRLTAKVVAGGKTYSFSAKGFGGYNTDRETYWFELMTKKGDIYEGEISKSWHDVETKMLGGDSDEPEGGFLPAGWDEPFDAYLWRNEHGKDGRLGTDTTGRAQKAMDAVKALKRVELAEFDPAWGTVAVTISAKGVTKISGKTADGVKVRQTSFLMLDDDDCHIISDLTFYDKKTGLVYGGAVCWQPLFDEAGKVVDWDDECCNKKLRIYPFAPAD